MVFGVEERPDQENAGQLYDRIEARLNEPDFSPRRLYEKFGIEVLCTTDSALDDLAAHDKIRASGWAGDIRPTFRPDSLIQMDRPGWVEDIGRLSQISGIPITHFSDYLQALAERRIYFKSKGAVAIDLGVETPYTCQLSTQEADALFQKGLRGEVSAQDAAQFTGLMVYEMARISLEDGLVMQLHAGSYRNHNPQVLEPMALTAALISRCGWNGLAI